MTILSFSAYALWVLLAATFFRSAFSGRKLREISPANDAYRRRGAACLLAGIFFFLPPGSLPPFCNVPFGGVCVFVCLALGALVLRQRCALVPICAVGAILAVFFFYAYQRGMPGSFANLGTFVAMPFWEAATARELCGFLLLAAGFLLAGHQLVACAVGASFPASLQQLALGALFVVLFVPWNAAPHVRWPDAAVAGCDFLLFWVKVFCCSLLFSFCQPVWAGWRWIPFFCCGAGFFLVAGSGG